MGVPLSGLFMGVPLSGLFMGVPLSGRLLFEVKNCSGNSSLFTEKLKKIAHLEETAFEIGGIKIFKGKDRIVQLPARTGTTR